MYRFRFPRFLLILLFIFAFIVPLGFIVMVLWNNVLAVILNLTLINFWQALGLFALSRILFGGFPGKPGWRNHGRRRQQMEEMRNKWSHLSPEDKQEFKQQWKTRCGKEPVPDVSETKTNE